MHDQEKHLLHINSYYVDTKLYSETFRCLSKHYRQTVFIPIKQNRQEDNKVEIRNTELIYSKIIQKKHLILHNKKINIISDEILSLNLDDIDAVHAHNLFTDGAAALRLKKELGLKYVVSVRMTDISLQYKYMVHRRALAREILTEAEHIIFISPIYKHSLWSMMSRRFTDSLEHKVSILPNGIDEYWLTNTRDKTPYEERQKFKLIYVGQIIRRKNLHKLLNVLTHLNSINQSYELTVVGDIHVDERKFGEAMIKFMKSLPFVQYKGKLDSVQKIQVELSKHHVLVMPAVRELFGLVYIEAISQNTPVIYSRNEGISPYLDNLHVGVSVNPKNKRSIKEGIVNIRDEYNTYRNLVVHARKFNWNEITQKYISLYKSIYE